MTSLVTTYRKSYDPTAFIRIDLDLLIEFGGDYDTCALFAYLQYLLTTQGAIDNGGWVILSYDDIEEHLFMKRTAVDRAIENLTPIGLKIELKTSRFHSGAPVRHFRFDDDILDIALKHIASAYNERKHKRHADFKQRRTNRKKPFVGKQQKAFVENQQTIEDVFELEVKKDFHTTPTGGVVAPQKSIQTDTPKSHSHSEGMGDSTLTPNIQSGDNELENIPSRADEPPATRKPKKSMNDSADTSKGAGYQMVFGAVAKHVFRIADTEQAPIKRVGLIAGYLWGTTKAMQAPPRPKSETLEQRPANIVKDLEAFVGWYQVKYRDASLPLDLAKFAGHWLAFWATRKTVYEARQYEGVVWGAVETPKLDTPKDTDKGGGDDTIGVKALDFILSQLKDEDDNK